jgi:group I intron endonuclease
MRPCILYRAVNKVTGDDYVGITTDFERRKRAHETCSRRGAGCPYFSRALAKYGWDSFEWSVLAELPSIEAAREAEKQAIAGGMGKYNLTIGGEGILGFEHRAESRHKMSVAHRGKKLSTEHKEKLRQIGLANPRPPETYAAMHAARVGSKHSATTRAKISAACKGRKDTPEACARKRASHLGKPLTEAHKAAIKAGHARRKAQQSG